MDASNKNKIIAAVLRELGTGAVDLTSDAERYRLLAIKLIAAAAPWKWLKNAFVTLTVEAGKDYINLPSYLEGAICLYQTSAGGAIREISAMEYARKMSAVNTSADEAAYFLPVGSKILFYPPLNAGATVIVLADINHLQLSAVSDTEITGVEKLIPSDFELLVEHKILGDLDSLGNKGSWLTLYDKELNDKIIINRRLIGGLKTTSDPVMQSMKRFYN